MPRFPWFAGRDHDSEVIRFIEETSSKQEKSALSQISVFLLSTSLAVRAVGRRAVHHLLKQMPARRLLELDDEVRRSWTWNISNDWEHVSPGVIRDLTSDGSTRSSVLGLLSFHRNGHVRQEAIRLLAWIPIGGIPANFLAVKGLIPARDSGISWD